VVSARSLVILIAPGPVLGALGLCTCLLPNAQFDHHTAENNNFAGDGDGDGETEFLQQQPGKTCDKPLWCYTDDLFNPVGGPIWIQECFTADMAPPFVLTRIEYQLAARDAELGPFQFELRAFDVPSQSPGEILYSQEVNPDSEAIVGTNQILMDIPPTLESQHFCVGFSTELPKLKSALGVAIATESNLAASSYFRFEGDGRCSVPDWADIIAFKPNPTGNWCLSAEIRRR